MQHFPSLFIVLILSSFIACKRQDTAMDIPTCMPRYAEDAYTWPVRPGTDAWDRLTTRPERVRACQIPRKSLQEISTKGLLETMLNYPLIMDFYAYNFYQSGFSRMCRECNGFPVLFERPDLFAEISSYYREISLSCSENIYPPRIVPGRAGAPLDIALQTVEMFMFQDEFLQTLKTEEKYALFHVVQEKTHQKIEQGFPEQQLITSTALLGKLMFSMRYEPFSFQCIDSHLMMLYIEDVPSMGANWGIDPVQRILDAASGFSEAGSDRVALN